MQEVITDSYFANTDKFNLNKEGYRIAFTFEDFKGKRLDDPRYVRILARLRQTIEGKNIDTLLPFHDCTKDDMSEFYPVSKSSSDLLTEMNEDANRNFFCLDWTDDLNLNGEFGSEHSFLEFFLLPCNTLFTERGYTGDTVSDECKERNANLEEQ